MSEFLKSAFDYFGTGGKSKGTNELINSTIEVGNQCFKVMNVIAEGGFAVVFETQDIKTHKMYALKRLLSHDTDTSTAITEEIAYLKTLSDHSNIIKLVTASSVALEKSGPASSEFFIVTELCTGGPVLQLMQRRNKAFPYAITLQMFNHVSKAIEHMHRQSPPIIHRDLKVDNLLISHNAIIKLCDFGSATTKVQCPDNSWSGQRRSEVQEEIDKHTTPMYRSPEMIDLYQNFPIHSACDIWALGCVLYYFYFNKHPFEDSAKLAILNANYTIPQTDLDCTLIYQMLVIDPRQRMGISEIINEVQLKALNLNIPLKPSIDFDKESLIHLPALSTFPNEVPPTGPNTNRPPPPARPKPLIHSNLPDLPATPDSKESLRQSTKLPDIPQNSTPIKSSTPTAVPNVNDGKKVLGLLKEGAGSLFKNIREVSNKVMEQVSSSINKPELDLIYVTSRIIMMPIPAEAGIELLTKDKVDDVQTFLDFRHPNQYYIYNLGLRYVSNDKFKDRLMHVGFDPLKPPPLNNLVMLCIHQFQWLLLDPKNVIVIQCIDGRIASGINAVALLCFCRLVNSSSDAVDIVKSRRGDCHFTPSQLRYANYVFRLMKDICDPRKGPDIPHNLSVIITGIDLQPVPNFNRAKTGLRPFVEIFCDYKLVHTSIRNYEDLPLFTHDDKSVHVKIPNISIHGDLNIVIYHTRSNIVAKGKIYSLKVCEVQLYSGYLSPDSTEVCFEKNQLDHCDSDDEKYPKRFSLKIQFLVKDKDAISSNQIQTLSWNSAKFKNEILNRISRDDQLVPFSSKDEMEACLTASGIKLSANKLKPKISQSTNKSKMSEPTEEIYFTPDWAKQDDKYIDETSPQTPPANLDPYSDDKVDIQCDEYVQIEAVGDLLGDFGAGEPLQTNNSAPQFPVKTDVDGLADFFSGFSATNMQNTKSNSDVDLLGSISNTESKTDTNLLFFESSHNDKSQSFMFDPFGQNTINSNSTVDLTNHQSLLGDLETNPVSGSLTNPQGQSALKPSNSTSNLLNMKNSNPMKTSPSFHGNEGPQKIDDFANLTDVHPKSSTNAKPKPATAYNVLFRGQEPVENIQPKNRKNAFQDLLGDFKPSDARNGSANNGAKSIKDIRKETMSRTTDPEALKVLDWIDGKEKNIRALLCSLPSILWSDVRWSGVNMSELVTVTQVKKAYKNAIRCVHPDKWNNSEHENLAKMIMMELNEAMTEFEAEKNACQ